MPCIAWPRGLQLPDARQDRQPDILTRHVAGGQEFIGPQSRHLGRCLTVLIELLLGTDPEFPIRQRTIVCQFGHERGKRSGEFNELDIKNVKVGPDADHAHTLADQAPSRAICIQSPYAAIVTPQLQPALIGSKDAKFFISLAFWHD